MARGSDPRRELPELFTRSGGRHVVPLLADALDEELG